MKTSMFNSASFDYSQHFSLEFRSVRLSVVESMIHSVSCVYRRTFIDREHEIKWAHAVSQAAAGRQALTT